MICIGYTELKNISIRFLLEGVGDISIFFLQRIPLYIHSGCKKRSAGFNLSGHPQNTDDRSDLHLQLRGEAVHQEGTHTVHLTCLCTLRLRLYMSLYTQRRGSTSRRYKYSTLYISLYTLRRGSISRRYTYSTLYMSLYTQRRGSISRRYTCSTLYMSFTLRGEEVHQQGRQ